MTDEWREDEWNDGPKDIVEIDLRCHYCRATATTIRQGALVCWYHAIKLRQIGWA